MRPAYIWTERDHITRLDAMRELLAKANTEVSHAPVGRPGVSATVAAALVAATAAARIARRYLGLVVRRPC